MTTALQLRATSQSFIAQRNRCLQEKLDAYEDEYRKDFQRHADQGEFEMRVILYNENDIVTPRWLFGLWRSPVPGPALKEWLKRFEKDGFKVKMSWMYEGYRSFAIDFSWKE